MEPAFFSDPTEISHNLSQPSHVFLSQMVGKKNEGSQKYKRSSAGSLKVLVLWWGPSEDLSHLLLKMCSNNLFQNLIMFWSEKRFDFCFPLSLVISFNNFPLKFLFSLTIFMIVETNRRHQKLLDGKRVSCLMICIEMPLAVSLCCIWWSEREKGYTAMIIKKREDLWTKLQMGYGIGFFFL